MKSSQLEIVGKVTLSYREEIKKAGLQESIWQYFTVLPGIRSVGVMGDGRTYDEGRHSGRYQSTG